MILSEYYDIIIQKYEVNDFKIKAKNANTPKPEINPKEFPLIAVNYIIYEFLKDNKDPRFKLILNWVAIPNGVNQKDCDIDFSNYSFEDVFEFMIKAKT